MSIMAVTAAATSIKVEYGRTKTTKHATTYLHGTNTHTQSTPSRLLGGRPANSPAEPFT